MATDPAELYDQDFYGWTRHQAAALRQVAAERVNLAAPLDLAHLAEEIEDLGKSQARELESRYMRLLVHLLKWEFQPSQRSGSWRGTVNEQRIELERLLEQSPGLKPRRPVALRRAYDDARSLASDETGLPLPTFPERSPYSLTEAMDRRFWPGDP